jgi:hypothetical protein
MNTTSPTGYSGTPLAKKLGYKPASRVFVFGAPDDYRSLLEPLPEGVSFDAEPTTLTDLVHLFVTQETELARELQLLRKQLRPDVPAWVSWPKKSSRVATTVTEDNIREIALPLGFVDVKVCAVTDIWSGLKLMVRKELR